MIITHLAQTEGNTDDGKTIIPGQALCMWTPEICYADSILASENNKNLL